MKYSILAFFLTLITTALLIRYKYFHEKFSNDDDLRGPQKFHRVIVPRIGGIGIFVSILITCLVALITDTSERGILLLQILICSVPTFFIGLTEDLSKKVAITTRLLFTIASSILAIKLLNLPITEIEILGFDWLLSIPFISITFTIICITGLTNSYNMIDGLNGLASMVGMITLMAIGYVAFKVGDPLLTFASLIIIGSIAGFFIWNYPRGLIFLGDGGAYLIGYLIAVISILLVHRSSNVSPWFALLVNIYPIFETIFTIWRRLIYQRKNPALPDGAHFHSLIYRRLIRWVKVSQTGQRYSHTQNASASPYLWVLSSMAVFPAVIWWDTTWILQVFSLLFCVSYALAYVVILNFRITSNSIKPKYKQHKRKY